MCSGEWSLAFDLLKSMTSSLDFEVLRTRLLSLHHNSSWSPLVCSRPHPRWIPDQQRLYLQQVLLWSLTDKLGCSHLWNMWRVWDSTHSLVGRQCLVWVWKTNTCQPWCSVALWGNLKSMHKVFSFLVCVWEWMMSVKSRTPHVAAGLLIFYHIVQIMHEWFGQYSVHFSYQKKKSAELLHIRSEHKT